MSKVYSFRLSDDNPREVQAREVIEAWMGEGYSLRHVVVETLLSKTTQEIEKVELSSIIEHLQYLVLLLEQQPSTRPSDSPLSNSFLQAVTSSIKKGVRI